jgi:octaprenyl-diphosphate synthase
LLAKGLLLSLENNDFKTLHILSDAVSRMSEGELLQLEKSRLLNITEEDYFNIIKNKTASLLASACAAGANSTTDDDQFIEKMKLFGEYTGIAFQIKDDLFDYGTDDVGKPTGNDIKEKKLTLPIIYTLQNADNNKRKQLKYLLKNSNRRKESVNFIIEEVKKSGGIEYTVQKMDEFKTKALEILHSFPPSSTRDSLETLVRYTTERKR